jgi:MoaA/NifB/PqqE/SkfB family radical SAM enzyme
MCGFGGQTISKDLFMKKNILNSIFEVNDFWSELQEIRLNGRGESTLYPNFAETLQTLKHSFPTARLSLFTNLMMPDPKILEALKKLKAEVYVSVDSTEPSEYESIRRGAKFKLLMERLPIVDSGFIVFTLQKNNFFKIKEMGELASKLGFGLIINVLRTDDPFLKAEFEKALNNHWDDLIQQLVTLHSSFPKNRLLIPDQIWGRPIPDNVSTTISCGRLPVCPNITSELMVAYNGQVYPCNMFNPTVYGDLNCKSIHKIWKSEQHIDFWKNHKEHYYCQNCEYMIPKEIL